MTFGFLHSVFCVSAKCHNSMIFFFILFATQKNVTKTQERNLWQGDLLEGEETSKKAYRCLGLLRLYAASKGYVLHAITSKWCVETSLLFCTATGSLDSCWVIINGPLFTHCVVDFHSGSHASKHFPIDKGCPNNWPLPIHVHLTKPCVMRVKSVAQEHNTVSPAFDPNLENPKFIALKPILMTYNTGQNPLWLRLIGKCVFQKISIPPSWKVFWFPVYMYSVQM